MLKNVVNKKNQHVFEFLRYSPRAKHVSVLHLILRHCNTVGLYLVCGSCRALTTKPGFSMNCLITNKTV